MLGEFSKCLGRPVEDFDVRDTSSIKTSVTSSVMKSVALTSASASVLSKGLRNRAFTIVAGEPCYADLPSLECTIASYELPKSIDDITGVKPMKQSTYKTTIKIATNPFSQGGVRLAYYGQLV